MLFSLVPELYRNTFIAERGSTFGRYNPTDAGKKLPYDEKLLVEYDFISNEFYYGRATALR